MRMWFFCLILLAITAYAVETPYVIFFFVKEYPEPAPLCQNNRPGLLQLDPGYLCVNATLKRYQMPKKVGIIATYNGFLGVSDRDGKVVFPRTTQQEEFLLVVTHDILPIYDLSNVIKEFRIPPASEYKAYSIKRIFDEETGTFLWQVDEASIPANRHIPLHSIVIHARPENVYVPLGVTITHSLPNLHLPTLLVKPGIDHLDNALFALTIKQYFAPMQRIYQKSPTGYDALVVTHEAVEVGA